MPPSTKHKLDTASKLRGIRRKYAPAVLELTRAAATAIRKIAQIEAAMAAEAAAVTGRAAPASFEAMYREFVDEPTTDVIGALESDALH